MSWSSSDPSAPHCTTEISNILCEILTPRKSMARSLLLWEQELIHDVLLALAGFQDAASFLKWIGKQRAAFLHPPVLETETVLQCTSITLGSQFSPLSIQMQPSILYFFFPPTNTFLENSIKIVIKNQCSAIIYGLCSKPVGIFPQLAQTFFTPSAQVRSETAENSHKDSHSPVISYASSLCPLIILFFFFLCKNCFSCWNF